MRAFQTIRYPIVHSPVVKGLLGLPLILGFGLVTAASASGETPLTPQQGLVENLHEDVDSPEETPLTPHADGTAEAPKPDESADNLELFEEDNCVFERFSWRHVLPLVPLTPTSDAEASADSPSGPEVDDTEPVPAKEAKYRVQREKVYFGNPGRFATPAMLSAAKVYAKIPTYKKILDRRLTKDDPEYWPLMRRASAAFVRGLKSVCSNEGYDLVGEVGSIEPVKKPASIPDITRAVTAAVRRVSIVRRTAVSEEETEKANDATVLKELRNFPDFGD